MFEIFKKTVTLNTIKSDALIGFFLGLSVFLVLAMFQPFGTYSYQDSGKLMLLAGYGIVVGITYFLSARILPLVFSKLYQKENWVYGKEIIHIIVIFILTATATYFYRNITLGFGYSIRGFLFYLGIALSTALFPLMIVFIIRYMKIKNEPIVIYEPVVVAQQNIYISIEGENKNEKLKFSKEELLFIKASDNYVVIHLDKNGKISKHMLRSPLSKIAQQIDDEDILQVHRSYLVNLENVENLNGKSPNYVLQLKSLKEEIPVSRTKVKSVKKRLSDKPV